MERLKTVCLKNIIPKGNIMPYSTCCRMAILLEHEKMFLMALCLFFPLFESYLNTPFKRNMVLNPHSHFPIPDSRLLPGATILYIPKLVYASQCNGSGGVDFAS